MLLFELFLEDFLDELFVFLEEPVAELDPEPPLATMSAAVLVASAPAWSSSAPSALKAEVSGTRATPPTAAASTSTQAPASTRWVSTHWRGEFSPARTSARKLPIAPLRKGVSMNRYETSATATTIATCTSISAGVVSVMSATGFMSSSSG